MQIYYYSIFVLAYREDGINWGINTFVSNVIILRLLVFDNWLIITWHRYRILTNNRNPTVINKIPEILWRHSKLMILRTANMLLWHICKILFNSFRYLIRLLCLIHQSRFLVKKVMIPLHEVFISLSFSQCILNDGFLSLSYTVWTPSAMDELVSAYSVANCTFYFSVFYVVGTLPLPSSCRIISTYFSHPHCGTRRITSVSPPSASFGPLNPMLHL